MDKDLPQVTHLLERELPGRFLFKVSQSRRHIVEELLALQPAPRTGSACLDVFLNDASVTAATVTSRRGQSVMAGSLAYKAQCKHRRERETVSSGSSWLGAQVLSVKIKVTK